MLSFLGRPSAIACLSGSGAGNDISGTVKFYKRSCGVLVVAEISGLPRNNEAGFFAFHIHEGTDCCGEGYSNSGSHYNPQGALHPEHAGDLPPLLSCNGWAYMAVMTNRFQLRDIIGRTVIIHGGPDDFHTQPSGNAGNKIACGVIREL